MNWAGTIVPAGRWSPQRIFFCQIWKIIWNWSTALSSKPLQIVLSNPSPGDWMTRNPICFQSSHFLVSLIWKKQQLMKCTEFLAVTLCFPSFPPNYRCPPYYNGSIEFCIQGITVKSKYVFSFSETSKTIPSIYTKLLAQSLSSENINGLVPKLIKTFDDRKSFLYV